MDSASEDVDRSSDSSDEDEDEGGPVKKRSSKDIPEGEFAVSPEQRIFEEVSDIVDGAHADEAEKKLSGSGRSAASLKAHVYGEY